MVVEERKEVGRWRERRSSERRGEQGERRCEHLLKERWGLRASEDEWKRGVENEESYVSIVSLQHLQRGR